MIACPSPSGGGKQPDSADATLTFQQVVVRTSKHLVDANGCATQTFTNTLLNNGKLHLHRDRPLQPAPVPRSGGAGTTLYVIAGSESSGAVYDIWGSTNLGATWTQTTAVPTFGSLGSISRHASVVVANRVYVIGGFHGSSDVNRVWRSDTDNVVDQNWTQVATGTRFSARRSHSAVVLDGAIYVISGFDGTNRLNDVWRSADQGVTWTNVHAAP